MAEFESLHVVSAVILTDANATLYRIEHAGVWDPPEGDDRPTVYYEDEELPPGAVSLYRVEVAKDAHAAAKGGAPSRWWQTPSHLHVTAFGAALLVHRATEASSWRAVVLAGVGVGVWAWSWRVCSHIEKELRRAR